MTISFCTNDGGGNDTGRVSAIHLDDALELEWGEIGSEPRYSIKGKILRLSRRRFPILYATEWYGNWCWTGISLDESVAVELLNYLSQDDRWHCNGGLCDLTDAYADGKITPELLAEAIA